MIGADAEILDDLAARLAIEEVTRRGCLGHFLQAVRAVRFHQLQSRKRDFNAGAMSGTGDPGPPSRARCRRAYRLRCVRAGRRNSRGPGADAAGCGTSASADVSRLRSARVSGPGAVATDNAGGTRRDLDRSGRWAKHDKCTETKPQRHASPNQGRRHDVLPPNQAGITSGDLRESVKPGGVRIEVAILDIAH